MTTTIIYRPARIKHRPHRTTAVYRGREPRPDDLIASHLRHLLQAPCSRCSNVRWLLFTEGLCTPCRGQMLPCRGHQPPRRRDRDCTSCKAMPQ